ncbi:uncharacterized protein LOC128922503 [Zeugodacus cucurbitae]|uniref:uncharacterized protein LOC128922503 n=1 Tax=Zeugodacus cucurbitae TaxID=28588 RepID=UPI0023D90DE4|nr:uncharacterized protein LOC128922503 [Zeugodacus cucurbitae]
MHILRLSKSIAIIKNSFVGHKLCNHFHNNKAVIKKRDFFIKKDNVSSEYELIYRAPMETYISIAKNISTVTATIISSAAIYSVTNEYKITTPSFESMGLVSHPNDLWYFSFGFIAVTMVIRLFIAKYPLRIYGGIDKYIAVYEPQLPFQSSKYVFNKGDVEEVFSRFNPWNNCTYRLGNKTSLLLNRYFRTPADYNQMLGYY